MSNTKELVTTSGMNLVTYALARMRGAARSEAAIEAGSKASTPASASSTARSIEEHVDFPRALEVARTLWSRATLPVLEQAQNAMVRDLENGDWRCRHSAAEWLREVHAGGKTTTHEIGDSFWQVLAAAGKGTNKRQLPATQVQPLPAPNDD